MKRIKLVLILISIVAIIIAGYFAYKYLVHHQPIPAGAVNIESPLKNGKFWVVQSGKNGKIHSIPSEKYALDITQYPTLKTWFRFRKSALEQDPSFGTPIYSPCKGLILQVQQDFPDVPIGVNGSAAEANVVAVRCDGFGVSMVHFKQNSVVVKINDLVSVGDLIGLMGNSGNSSGPHLHIAAFKKDPVTQEAINVPLTFDGQYFYRGDSFTN